MRKKKKPLVFMDVSIDGDPVERMVFKVLSWLYVYCLCCNICNGKPNDNSPLQLLSNVAPMTAENFRALCTGIIKLICVRNYMYLDMLMINELPIPDFLPFCMKFSFCVQEKKVRVQILENHLTTRVLSSIRL